MTTRTRLALRVASVLLLGGLAVYAHMLLNTVTTAFEDDRSLLTQHYADVIHANWACIKGSDADKHVLLDMIDADARSHDIEVMHRIVIVLLYGLLASAAANQLAVIRTLWSERPRR